MMNTLRFTKTHEWVETDAEAMTVGITDHAQQLLGDLVYVELPEIGRMVEEGDELGVVESVKAASDFYAPIGGEVVAINEAISGNPELVNTDPYHAGWLVKIKPFSEDTTHLLNESEYLASLEEAH
jgi:glycine cleavage system H protein